MKPETKDSERKLERLLAALLGVKLPATKEELLKLPGIGAKKLAALQRAGLVKPGFRFRVVNREQRIAETQAVIEKHKTALAKAEARLAKLMALDA